LYSNISRFSNGVQIYGFYLKKKIFEPLFPLKKLLKITRDSPQNRSIFNSTIISFFFA